MSPPHCNICDTASFFYCKNITKLRSKHSDTLICDFIKKFLGSELSEQREVELLNADGVVCAECLSKIDEYDLACVTAERVEKELREVLLQTDLLRLNPVTTSSDLPFDCVDVKTEETDEFDSKAILIGIDDVPSDTSNDQDYEPPARYKKKLFSCDTCGLKK